MSNSEYNLMNQMPISECYLSKFNMQPHYHRLIVYIHVGPQGQYQEAAGSQSSREGRIIGNFKMISFKVSFFIY